MLYPLSYEAANRTLEEGSAREERWELTGRRRSKSDSDPRRSSSGGTRPGLSRRGSELGGSHPTTRPPNFPASGLWVDLGAPQPPQRAGIRSRLASPEPRRSGRVLG